MKRTICILLIGMFICGCSSVQPATTTEQQPDSSSDESVAAPMAEPGPAIMYDYDGNVITDPASVSQDTDAKVPMVERDQALAMLKAAYSDDDAIDYEVSYDSSIDTYTISIKSGNMAQTAIASALGTEPETTNWNNICDSVISIDGDAQRLLETLGYPDSHMSVCIESEKDAGVILFATLDGECVVNVGEMK